MSLNIQSGLVFEGFVAHQHSLSHILLKTHLELEIRGIKVL